MAVRTAGVPNIIGETKMLAGLYLSNDYNGAIKTTACNWSGGAAAIGEGWNKAQIFFDASQSNKIYGTSPTVQPPALSLLPQIRY